MRWLGTWQASPSPGAAQRLRSSGGRSSESGRRMGQREADPAQRPVLIAVIGPAPVARVQQGHRRQAQRPAEDQAGATDRMQPTGGHLHDLTGPAPRPDAIGADYPLILVAAHAESPYRPH